MLTNLERVQAMTVAEFAARHKLSGQIRNDLVEIAKRRIDNAWRHPDWRVYHKQMRELANTVTMRDALAALPSTDGGDGPYELKHRNPKLADALMAEGLTYLDVPSLPMTTLSAQELRKIPKSDLLALDARRLGTLSSAAMRVYVYDSPYRERRPVSTVGELLASDHWGNDYQLDNCEQSLLNTRRRLAEIGFTYEDGLFMQHGTRRQFLEKIVAESGLTKKAAEKVADLAMKYRWVTKFNG